MSKKNTQNHENISKFKEIIIIGKGFSAISAVEITPSENMKIKEILSVLYEGEKLGAKPPTRNFTLCGRAWSSSQDMQTK